MFWVQSDMLLSRSSTIFLSRLLSCPDQIRLLQKSAKMRNSSKFMIVTAHQLQWAAVFDLSVCCRRLVAALQLQLQQTGLAVCAPDCQSAPADKQQKQQHLRAHYFRSVASLATAVGQQQQQCTAAQATGPSPVVKLALGCCS
jgi:hypothetical protein